MPLKAHGPRIKTLLKLSEKVSMVLRHLPSCTIYYLNSLFTYFATQNMNVLNKSNIYSAVLVLLMEFVCVFPRTFNTYFVFFYTFAVDPPPFNLLWKLRMMCCLSEFNIIYFFLYFEIGANDWFCPNWT